MSKYCQNGQCKRKACVTLNTPETTKRQTVDLCAEDAAYFLHLRDEVKDEGVRANKFVAGCHQN